MPPEDAPPSTRLSAVVSGTGFGGRVHPDTGRWAAPGYRGGPVGDHFEEELWDKLSALEAEQLTGVLEDAGAVLFHDRTMHAWLRWRRKYEPNILGLPDEVFDESRKFIPAYADIVDAVEEWMDEREGVATGARARRGRRWWARLGASMPSAPS